MPEVNSLPGSFKTTSQNMNLELIILSLFIFFLAFGTSFLITPLTRKYSITRRLHDKKTSRTVHKKVITRMGGTAIYAGISVSLLVLFLMGRLRPEISALFTGMTLIFIIGLLDDVKDLSAYIKLVAQLAACLIIIRAGFGIRAFTIPFFETSVLLPTAASYILTIIWILLITNSANFIDGLDGLAAGIMSIASLLLFGISIRAGRLDLAVAFIAVAGSCLGFLRHNFHPAKVFMGDSGSTTIGFTIGCLTLFSTIKAPAVFPLLIPLIALGIPAGDLLLAVLRRVKNRKSPFSPDKKHIHHKLMETGLTHKEAVFALYAITIMLGSIALNFSPDPSIATISFSFLCAGLVLVAAKRVFSRKAKE